MKPVEIFFSYAHEDEKLLEIVRKHLVILERQGLIIKWYDRKIPAGSDWAQHIDSHLRYSQIVLLLISAHFIASKYCYEKEMSEALRRHDAGEARVIPIILSPCLWHPSPFGKLMALPKDGRPITTWNNIDEACLDIAEGISRIVHEIGDSKKPKVGSLRKKSKPKLESISSDKAEGIATYCKRCGTIAGARTVCTGVYSHHEFTQGPTQAFCKRCGQPVGERTICTGNYVHHEFLNRSKNSYCKRCGSVPGIRSICTGSYTHHDF